MDDQYTLLLGGVVFLGFAVIVCIVRAYREKDEGYYVGAGASFLMLLFCVSVIFQQRLVAWFFLCSGGVVAILGMPTIHRLIERKTAENLQGVDVSAPLRGRDLLTQTGLLKTAYRWGVRKALFLFWLLMAAVIVGVLGLWFGMSVGFIVAYTFSLAIPMTAIYYRAVSKALKSIEKSKESENDETSGRSIGFGRDFGDG